MIVTHPSGVAGVLSIFLCTCLSLRATDATSYQDWQFTNNANPAVPTVTTNSSGMASATMVVSGAGQGWLADLTGFGTQTGLWDLGFQNSNDFGRVILSIPVPVGGSNHTDLKLRLVQLVDGIYPGNLTFSLPGATNIGRTVVEALPGPLGGNWVEDEFRWRLAPSPEQVSLSITGAVFGPVLDRIRVDTTSPAVTVPKLTILSVQKQGNILTINWTGGIPPYQVYATSNLLNTAVWQPLGPVVSVTNANVTIDGPVGFVRVGGSN